MLSFQLIKTFKFLSSQENVLLSFLSLDNSKQNKSYLSNKIITITKESTYRSFLILFITSNIFISSLHLQSSIISFIYEQQDLNFKFYNQFIKKNSFAHR
jgi:hypothetical protein